eukprot:2433900-Rhodomonas_salina.1
MLAQLCQDCPELTRDREAFLEHVRGVLESLASGEGLSRGARTVPGVGAKAPSARIPVCNMEMRVLRQYTARLSHTNSLSQFAVSPAWGGVACSLLERCARM